MVTLIVLGYVAAYVIGAGHFIRWGSRRADQPIPDWGSVIGMLFLPPLVLRFTAWAIPDSIESHLAWLPTAASLLTLLVLLKFYFKLRTGDSFLIWFLIIGSAVLTRISVEPLLHPHAP